MAKIFPNNPSKQVWKHPRKGYITLINEAFAISPVDQPLTEADKTQALIDSMKPYNSDDLKKLKVIQAKGGYEEPTPPSPPPSPTPTPTNTPTQTVTPTPTNTSSPTPTNTPTNTSSPTPTPTITPTSSPITFDPDAALYLADVLSAGGSVDATMSAATNTLFTDLKSNNLYDKLKLFYPIIGGIEASNKLMGKRVSGTTYDLNFTGSWTHNYSGSSANDDFSPATMGWIATTGNTDLNSHHYSVYLGTTGRTYTSGAVYMTEFGEMDTIFNTRFLGCLIGVEYNVDSGNSYFGTLTNNLKQVNKATMSASTGFIGYTRVNTTNSYVYKNSTQVLHDTETRNQDFPTNTLGSPFYRVALGANIRTSQRRRQFITFGEGLSTTEITTLENIINTFQTTLGRNTY